MVLVLVVKVLNAGFECAEYFRVLCHISCKNTSKTWTKEGVNTRGLIIKFKEQCRDGISVYRYIGTFLNIGYRLSVSVKVGTDKISAIGYRVW